jgi:hypothetical protein
MMRNPRQQPRDNYTGAVCVTRCGFTMAAFESLLEMHYVVQRDAFDFELTDIKAQPMTGKYWYDGKFRTWTPDFRVSSGGDSRHELVEVKSWSYLYPADEERRAWIHGKFIAIANEVNNLTVKEEDGTKHGFRFVLCTDREIRVQPRQYNAELMTGAVSKRTPPDAFKAELAVIALPHRTSVFDLQQTMGPKHDAFALALYLAWRGVIRLDPTEKWTRDSTFERTSRQL